MRRISLCAVIVLWVPGCGEDHGPPFICDSLEPEVAIEHGRRPNLDAYPSRPFRAGDALPTFESTRLGPESPESLAYRAAALGCAMGLEEIPGSIRTWAENTRGRVITPLEQPDDPWETFEIEGVTFSVLKSASDREQRGTLTARREWGTATLDQLPDAVGFPIVQDVIHGLIDADVLAFDSITVPASYAERPPLSPERERSDFHFKLRVQGMRMFVHGGVSVSLAADGSVRSISITDAHVDEREPVTLRRGEIEAAPAIREDIPESNVVDREELVYAEASIEGGFEYHLIHRAPGGGRHLRVLSLASDDATYVEYQTERGFDANWW